ncbi:N-acetylmuramoyl-L-alanine amidase [candidate division KSB1 bacterium]|nr:N-acetylmuramoyl-L-alanine amidase [candidate division KSB1 bacterium]
MNRNNLIKFIWITVWANIIFPPAVFGTSPDSLKLRITFPAHSDTVHTDKIRIAGGTESGASVYINGQSVHVYRHGAFVSRVNLQEGENTIIIRARKNGRQVEDTLSVFRPPGLKSTPTTPTAIDSVFFEPTEDIWLMPGDVLQVACKASPGASARFYLDEGMDWQPMIEQPAAAVSGIYRGSVRIPYHLSDRWMRIHFQVCGSDTICAEAVAPARVRALPFETPLVGMTAPETQLWTASGGGTVTAMLPDSIGLQIIGKENHRYRIALTRCRSLYVHESDLALLPPGATIRNSFVTSPSITISDDWIKLAMRMEHRIPFTVEQSVEPAVLDLTFYGAYQSSPWIKFPEEATELENILWSQPSEDLLRLRIFLAQPQQWGYRAGYEGDIFHFLIRRTPQLISDHRTPLQGLNIVVDAGHGGSEPGAISPTGIEEKDVNLVISKALTQWLRNAGAKVRMTRTTDTTLTLQERVEMARKHQAHLFLWIHNNSVGAATDAAAVSGTSTYFTLPQNQRLAWTVYPHLRALGLNPFGRISSSYYVTRTSDMLVLLVEGAFMSHPLDERKLSDKAFLRKIAKAIYDGVVEFVQHSSNNKSKP